jgi:signal transduction histidine kinase
MVAAAIAIAWVLTTLQWQSVTHVSAVGALDALAGNVNRVSMVDFNPSWYNLVWLLGTVVLLIVLGVLMLLQYQQVYDAPLKLIFVVVMLVGYGYALSAFNAGTLRGDELSTVNLAFMVAMPLYAAVVYRFVIARLGMLLQEKVTQAADAAQQATMAAIISDNNSERDAVAVLKSLGQMLERDNPEDLPQQIVVSVASSLKADVVAMLILDDAEYADVIAAYDNVQRRPIAAMALKRTDQVTLEEAISKRAQRTLNTEKNLNELVDLYTRLDIQKVGPAYLQPLTREGRTVGVLIIAMPYTGRIFRENETRLLEAVGPIAARLLMISRAAHRTRIENEERNVATIVQGAGESTPPDLPVSAARADMYASLETARNQINDLTSRVRDLQIELDYERSRMAELSGNDPEGLTITQRLEAMQSERAQLEAERERLMGALQEAQTQLATASGNGQDVYDTMLAMLQQERDELQAQRAKLEDELNHIRARGMTETPALLRETLMRMSEERARLAVERDAIKQQLDGVQQQIAALGIEGGPAGLAATLMQLTDERSYFKALADRMTTERDTLLAERQRLVAQITPDAQRDKIVSMETELRRLAEDREALARQRDSLRTERDSLSQDRAKWEQLRAKMVAEMAGLQNDLEEAIFERNRLIQERTKMVQERTQWLSERDKLIADRTALGAERDQLRARVEGNREMLQQLGADGVGTLKAMIDDLTEERSALEHGLVKAQDQIQGLQRKLDQAELAIRQAAAMTSKGIDPHTAEVMLSIAQELRTPMSSIGAYVDLLLGESVGILGALQKQFLTRVKANTDRLATLIEDFVKVTAIDTGQLNLKPEDVDMDEVINTALTATRSQFREKNIALRLDVPDEMPRVKGDRDALQQILIQLLSNAYLASPAEGEVLFSARFEPRFTFQRGQQSLTSDVIVIAVRDFGGGIPPEEQARVFSRLYRADNPLIQGLGDTGVGLSIARALTEAHGGRIWLESVKNTSSTFKLVIPVEGTLVPQKA